MSKTYVVALDQGTTSSRAMLIDREGRVADVVQNPFPQIFPKPGWVEHDPRDILSSQLGALTELLVSNDLGPHDIDSIGITNQRETTVVWNRETGQPVANAIVWQCRRTAPLVEELCGVPEIAAEVTRRTGLVPDAYFSASKIRWILDNVPGAREDALQGKLAFGTVDSWLLWALTQGEVHATDVTNASRTMLFNIHDMKWDPWLLDLFDIPASMLPEVRPSSGDFGVTRNPAVFPGVPIRGIAGDQQAALFGQGCFTRGQAKNTYGTGCFTLMNVGGAPVRSRAGLVTTVGWSLNGETTYALEGSVFNAGSAIQWLRDELQVISTSHECDILAESVPDSGGIYLVPAFTGLGAPYWDMYARGCVVGITRGTTKAHFARAVLESIAYQVTDLMTAMRQDAGCEISLLRVDGGASVSDLMMQFQADLLRIPVDRPAMVETTAFGAASLAGLAAGVWKDLDELSTLRCSERVFTPERAQYECEELYRGWKRAVGCAQGWVEKK